MTDYKKKLIGRLVRGAEERDAAVARNDNNSETTITSAEQARRDAGESSREHGIPEPVEKKSTLRNIIYGTILTVALGAIAYFPKNCDGYGDIYEKFSNNLFSGNAPNTPNTVTPNTVTPNTVTPNTVTPNTVLGETPTGLTELTPLPSGFMEETTDVTLSESGVEVRGDIVGERVGAALRPSPEPSLSVLIDHDNDPHTHGITPNELKKKCSEVVKHGYLHLDTVIDFLERTRGTPLFYLMQPAVTDQRADVVHLLIAYGLGNKGIASVELKTWDEVCRNAMEDYNLVLQPRGTTREEYNGVIYGVNLKKGCGKLLPDSLSMPYELPQGKVLRLTPKRDNSVIFKEEEIKGRN